MALPNPCAAGSQHTKAHRDSPMAQPGGNTRSLKGTADRSHRFGRHSDPKTWPQWHRTGLRVVRRGVAKGWGRLPREPGEPRLLRRTDAMPSAGAHKRASRWGGRPRRWPPPTAAEPRAQEAAPPVPAPRSDSVFLSGPLACRGVRRPSEQWPGTADASDEVAQSWGRDGEGSAANIHVARLFTRACMHSRVAHGAAAPEVSARERQLATGRRTTLSLNTGDIPRHTSHLSLALGSPTLDAGTSIASCNHAGQPARCEQGDEHGAGW